MSISDTGELGLLDFVAGAKRATRAAATRKAVAATHATYGEPECLVLVTLVTRCQTCGTTYRSPNVNTLVRYSVNEHALQFRKQDNDRFTHLPREQRTVEQSAPMCEGCFSRG